MLYNPTQLPIQIQWWSISNMHLLHIVQWCVRFGFVIQHILQLWLDWMNGNDEVLNVMALLVNIDWKCVIIHNDDDKVNKGVSMNLSVNELYEVNSE
jgi:hypothetical protein